MEKSEIQKIVNFLESKHPHGPEGNKNQIDSNCMSCSRTYLFYRGHTANVVEVLFDRKKGKKIDPHLELLLDTHIDEYQKIILPAWRNLRKQKVRSSHIFTLLALAVILMIVFWLIERAWY